MRNNQKASCSFMMVLFTTILTLAIGVLPARAQTSLNVTQPKDYFSAEIFQSGNSVMRIANPANGAAGLYVPQDPHRVRMIYLVPADKVPVKKYQIAMGNAILHLQNFWQAQMGNNYSFSTNAPLVEVYTTSHNSSYYDDAPIPNDFYQRVLQSMEELSIGFTGSDPFNRWMIYIDADPVCEQVFGGTDGIAVFPVRDLKGLAGVPNFICRHVGGPPGEPDPSGVCRWIGGLGHELGHSWFLPHPCPVAIPPVPCPSYIIESLMALGNFNYPNTYLLPENVTQLFNQSPNFFTQLALDGPRFSCNGNAIDDYRVFTRVQYIDFLAREPDQGGWDYWTSQITQCGSNASCLSSQRIGVSQAFFDSSEFVQGNPALNPIFRDSMDPVVVHNYNVAFVTACYQFYLQREPDTPGLNYWVGVLDQTHKYDQMIGAFINASEYRLRFGPDQ